MPEKASQLRRYITVIEGDHGSTYFYPDSEAAHKVIQWPSRTAKKSRWKCQYRPESSIPSYTQQDSVLSNVSPRMVYVDSSNLGLSRLHKEHFHGNDEVYVNPLLKLVYLTKEPLMKELRGCTEQQKQMGFFLLYIFQSIAAKTMSRRNLR